MKARITSQPPNLAITPEQWHADLGVFARELPARHVNAFHLTSRTAFDVAVHGLDGRLDGLDGAQSFVGLEQIARQIGDGHTGFRAPADSSQLPIRVSHFGEDTRIVDAAPGQEALLGARIEAIDSMPIDAVRRRLLTVTPADEGQGLRDGIVDMRLSLGLYLRGLGVTARRDRARLTLLTDDGRTLMVELAALPVGPEPRWISVQAAEPLTRQHLADPLWWAPAAPDTLYCNFRSYRGVGGPAAALRETLSRRPPSKLVIDMRQNGGGDYSVGLAELVEPIVRNAAVNRRGHLFVLIGPMTFSAAMSNSAHFRQRTAAILVGEPIGERPNGCQETGELTLPNSRLVLSYSTRFYQFAPGDPTNEIRPDVPIATAWADYAAGRDPVLQWVIDQPGAR